MSADLPLAITGATGFVGQAVMDEAARRGLPIRALTRKSQFDRAGVTWIEGSLEDEPALDRLLAGAGAVLHIAGVVNAAGWEGFERGNVTGTENVLNAMRRNPNARRIVHVSSLSAREPALSNYGRSKRLGEQLVEASEFDWTVIRPPAIYGPRDKEILEVFRAAKSGFVPMPPRGRASVIHVNDLARLLLDLVPPRPTVTKSRVFEADDGHKRGWSHEELARHIGAALEKRVVVLHMPAAIVKTAALIDRLFRGPDAKLTPDRASYMVHRDWTVRSAWAVPAEIWQPGIALAQGLADTAQWYREHGWI